MTLFVGFYTTKLKSHFYSLLTDGCNSVKTQQQYFWHNKKQKIKQRCKELLCISSINCAPGEKTEMFVLRDQKALEGNTDRGDHQGRGDEELEWRVSRRTAVKTKHHINASSQITAWFQVSLKWSVVSPKGFWRMSVSSWNRSTHFCGFSLSPAATVGFSSQRFFFTANYLKYLNPLLRASAFLTLETEGRLVVSNEASCGSCIWTWALVLSVPRFQCHDEMLQTWSRPPHIGCRTCWPLPILLLIHLSGYICGDGWCFEWRRNSILSVFLLSLYNLNVCKCVYLTFVACSFVLHI